MFGSILRWYIPLVIPARTAGLVKADAITSGVPEAADAIAAVPRSNGLIIGTLPIAAGFWNDCLYVAAASAKACNSGGRIFPCAAR